MSQSRQLAAIMFTDIVGYTTLMGNDEEKAFKFLKKNRELQKAIIEEFNGRWIKELGDGVMASFNTVLEAVMASIKIQEACNNARDFQLRIGIHLGEVVFENNDVFGDGVNIAARIQALAPPGGIWVSEAVHNNVYNKNYIVTELVKTVKLKNVNDPVRIYQVISDGVKSVRYALTPQQFILRHWLALLLLATIFILTAGYFIYPKFASQNTSLEIQGEKSIAVLPFVDMSPEKNQDFLGDGIAEEIINSISAINDLRVTGRTSSFQFKGKGMSAEAIGSRLNVDAVLEGTIQISGDILRITTSLIRIKDGSITWSQKFNLKLKDIFAVQDTIAANIVKRLKVTLSEIEKPRLVKRPVNPDAYTEYLKGLYSYIRQNYAQSIEFNLRAIAVDSTYAPSYAYIALAKTWIINASHTYDDFNAVREAKKYANHAIRLDPDIAEGYSALALMAWSVELDFAEAKENFEKSVQLNPSASLIKNRYGYFLVWMGDFDRAKSLALDAARNDPSDYNGYYVAGLASMYGRKFRDAEKYLEEGRQLFPENSLFEVALLKNKFYSGDYRAFIKSANALLKKDSTAVHVDLLSLLSIAYSKNGQQAESKNVFLQLKNAPEDGYSGINYHLSTVYLQYKMMDSCFLRLEKSFTHREVAFRILKIDPALDDIRKEQKYRELYRRYGFDRYK